MKRKFALVPLHKRACICARVSASVSVLVLFRIHSFLFLAPLFLLESHLVRSIYYYSIRSISHVSFLLFAVFCFIRCLPLKLTAYTFFPLSLLLVTVFPCSMRFARALLFVYLFVSFYCTPAFEWYNRRNGMSFA